MVDLTAALIVVVVVVSVSALMGLAFMATWNYVLPVVFSAPELTFLQAWALMLLISMVTHGFRRKD